MKKSQSKRPQFGRNSLLPFVDFEEHFDSLATELSVTYGALVWQAATKIEFMFILRRHVDCHYIHEKGDSSPNDQRNRSDIQ